MTNKTVADIFADFKSYNLAQKHRYEMACDKNSKLAAIREKAQEAALKKMECALSGQPSERYDQELAELAKQEKNVLAGLAEKRYRCERCRDTGVIDGSYCNCLKTRIYTQYYGAIDPAALAPDFDTYDFSIFDDETMLKSKRTQRQKMRLVVGIARNYMEEFPETKRRNMLLFGKAGLGKTYLLHCMARLAAKRGIDVLLIRANEMFQAFFAHRMGEEVDLSFLYGADLLLLDDIGTEPITQNVSIEYFYELIAKRLERGKHTVFATNVDDLQKRYDDRIASRLYSERDAIQVYLEGKDLRLQ